MVLLVKQLKAGHLIFIEPYEDVLIIRFRIDGILKEILRQDSDRINFISKN